MMTKNVITSQLSATVYHLAGPDSMPSGHFYMHDIVSHIFASPLFGASWGESMSKVFTITFLIAVLCSISCKTENNNGILIEEKTPIIDSEGMLTESIGIETLGGVFTPIIPPGHKLPVEVSKIFSTAVENQDKIMVKLYRGKAQLIKDTTALGNYQITGIRPAPRGEPQIEITFKVENSSIKLFAKDLGIGKELKIFKQ